MRANQENDESGYFGQPTISYIYQALCAAETIEIVMAEHHYHSRKTLVYLKNDTWVPARAGITNVK